MKFYNLSLLLSLLAVLYSGPAFAKKIEVNGLKVKVSYFRKRAAVLGPQNKDSFTVDSLFVPDFFDYNGRKYKAASISGFDSCNSLIYISLPSSCEVIDEMAFAECKSLVQVELTEGIRIIGKEAFRNCPDLSMVKLPPSIEEFKEACFQGCVSIEELVLPPLITEIPDAFLETITTFLRPSSESYHQASKLRSITIGPNVKTIGNWAFAGNIVHEVVIPENVQSIGIDAFASHNTLSDVYCLSKNPPVIDTGIETAENSDWSFHFVGPHKQKSEYSKRTLYVPKGHLEDYQKTPGWNMFDYIIEIQ
ncbi:MAG: leucine-rich repeat domain-containing protein [Bacteroidaceae bacterium]|jgi:hypothetical protein|nr:leucine-rich repeat domain-containing protein [Bacteroidaceae bacterium]MBP8603246.1 leucine-rich repeat domain-containing protein [Bacteroidaceae bacterium]HOD69336.1 leucine-rich repeat domain-containing protein [Bacteroidaceae bacterium]